MKKLAKKPLKKAGLVVRKLKKFFKKDFRILIPQIYLFGLLIGFIFTLLYATFPQLIVCSDLLGYEFCTPIGVFIALIINFPGYIISGNIFTRLANVPWLLSLFAVILISLVFYFLVGLSIDKYRKGTYKQRVVVCVIAIFVVLLTFLLLLL